MIDFYAENGSVKYKHKRFFTSHYVNGRKDNRNKHNVFFYVTLELDVSMSDEVYSY